LHMIFLTVHFVFGLSTQCLCQEAFGYLVSFALAVLAFGAALALVF